MVSFFFVLGLIAAIIVIVLAVHIFILPLRISGRIRTNRDFFLVRLRWGLLSAHVILSVRGTATLYLYSFRIKEFPPGEEEPAAEEEKKEKEGGIGISQIRSFVGEAAVIIDRIRFDYLRINARIGFGDAADTGILYGIASALGGIMAPSGKVSLNVIPVFETETLEFDLEAGIRVVNLYRIIAPAFRIFRNSRSRRAKNSGGAPAV